MVPVEFTDASRGVRLQKVLAEAAVASRRHCETMIEEGRVTVNGKAVTALPAWVDPASDRVVVDGRVVSGGRNAKPAASVTVVLHKPRHVICTMHDPEGRKRVTDLVDLPQRLFPVGRLDADSTGLILLTNDGDLAHRLTHPSYEVPKQYQVSVRGRLTEESLQRLREGLHLTPPRGAGARTGARRASVAQVKLLEPARSRTGSTDSRLSLTLREGRNRQIRRLLARLGFKVRRLQRVAIGPIRIKGLGVGQWRMITAAERRRLLAAVGLDKR